MNSLRIQAEELRDQGYSYNMISEVLGVTKGTMSYWFHNRPFTPNHEVIERIKYGPIKSGTLKHNKRILETKQTIDEAIAEIGVLSKRDIWMLGIGLYIGEGAKTVECVRIANADPAVIKIAIKWLEEACGLTKANIAIRLHLYPDSDVEASIGYWQTVTGLPIENFRKTMIDFRTNKTKAAKGKLQHGTVHLSVIANGDKAKGTVLFRRVKGWIQAALNQV